MKKNKEALNTSLQSAVQDIPIKYIEQAVSYDIIPASESLSRKRRIAVIAVCAALLSVIIGLSALFIGLSRHSAGPGTVLTADESSSLYPDTCPTDPDTTAYSDTGTGVPTDSNSFSGIGTEYYEEEPAPDSYIERRGDTVFFGTYPQTLVTDESLISVLNGIGGDVGSWQSFNYYSETSTGSPSDCVVYRDIVYKQQKFRGIHINEYRASYTLYTFNRTFSSSLRCFQKGYSHQYQNGFLKGETYWFSFDPIEWTVIDEKDGSLTLLSRYVLDAQKFADHCVYVDNNVLRIGTKVYSANKYYAYSGTDFEEYDFSEMIKIENGTEKIIQDATYYKSSTVRTWLNSRFFSSAFSAADNGLLQVTVVDNNFYSAEGSPTTKNAATEDYVFLISSKELTSYFRGWSSRIACGTEYAFSQGLKHDENNVVRWLTRSRQSAQSNCLVGFNGEPQYGELYYVFGVRPAITIADNVNGEKITDNTRIRLTASNDFELSPSLGSESEIKEIGLYSCGSYVEGLKIVSKGQLMMPDNDKYYPAETINEYFTENELDKVPVIRYTGDLKIISPSDYTVNSVTYTSMTDHSSVSDTPPSGKGAYLMRVNVTNPAPEVPRTDIYYGTYAYYFILLVE